MIFLNPFFKNHHLLQVGGARGNLPNLSSSRRNKFSIVKPNCCSSVQQSLMLHKKKKISTLCIGLKESLSCWCSSVFWIRIVAIEQGDYKVIHVRQHNGSLKESKAFYLNKKKTIQQSLSYVYSSINLTPSTLLHVPISNYY